jgi:hypothetical protein
MTGDGRAVRGAAPSVMVALGIELYLLQTPTQVRGEMWSHFWAGWRG